MTSELSSPSDLAFPPIADAAWPSEISDMLAGFAGRLNVYRVMAHNPALLRSWANYRDYVVTKNSLGPQRSEVAILRTGHRLNANYEWSHHVMRARACGMDDARILSLRGDVLEMSAEDQVIARAVDDLIDSACLSAHSREDLAKLVGTYGRFRCDRHGRPLHDARLHREKLCDPGRCGCSRAASRESDLASVGIVIARSAATKQSTLPPPLVLMVDRKSLRRRKHGLLRCARNDGV